MGIFPGQGEILTRVPNGGTAVARHGFRQMSNNLIELEKNRLLLCYFSNDSRHTTIK